MTSLPPKPSPSGPPSKKPRSTPSAATPNLLHRALSQSTRPSPAPSPAPSQSSQFEQQSDFISFSFSSDEESTPNGSGKGGYGNGKKRKLDEFEERREEGSKEFRKREKGRRCPWVEDVGVEWSRASSGIEMLNLETPSFITYISPSPIEHSLRLMTIELIRRTIRKKWKDSRVECFGSVGTGLYLPGGDIDLVLLSPSLPSPPSKPPSSLLHHLASLLLSSGLVNPSSLLVISKARVPIVKFTTKYGGFNVDLSVNQGGGVEAAVRVRGMLEDYSFRDSGVPPFNSERKSGEDGEGEGETPDLGVARSLVMLVKQFLNQRGMNEVFTGGLGSYSIICLVISFLQLHPKIQSGQISPLPNIGLLFVEFLEYYGKHFNYVDTGISLRGRGGYFNKRDKGWFRVNQPTLLSIEDPNDSQNDVSGGSHNIPRVRQTMAGAYEVLTATLLHRESHFKSRSDPTLTPLNGDCLPNSDSSSAPHSQSILGSIIGITKDQLRSREANIDLFEEGILQRLLEKEGGKKERQKEGRKKKEEEKRRKTVERLESRRLEKEEKEERKRVKKATLEKSLAPLAGSREGSQAPKTKKARKDEEVEESRYSIAPPPTTKKQDYLFVDDRGLSSDEDSDDGGDGEHDDNDVVIGGGHGDQLFGNSGAGSRVETEESESDGSSDLVVRSLLPPRDGERGTKEIQEETLSREKEERKRKQEERREFWSKKGEKEDGFGKQVDLILLSSSSGEDDE